MKSYNAQGRATDGRSSWDPMPLLMALIGDEKEAGYKTVMGTASVDEKNGANHFAIHTDGKHNSVVKEKSDKEFEEQICALLN